MKSPWICSYGLLSNATLEFGRPSFLPRIVEDDVNDSSSHSCFGPKFKKKETNIYIIINTENLPCVGKCEETEGPRS